MKINWFPGHMAKTVRMMKEEASLVDCFIYVLDARAPRASVNPEFFKIAGAKPVLYVLNKADLVSRADLEKWLKFYREQNLACIFADSLTGKIRTEIAQKLREINKERIERYKEKGVKMSVRAMVAGVPNGGKSTLINALAGEKRAATGDKPGVTRGKQWIAVGDGVELLDTPGVLPPNIHDEASATNLAIIGSISGDIIDPVELATEIARFFVSPTASGTPPYSKGELGENYGLFCARFKIKEINLPTVLEDVAKARGYVLKGGVFDAERTAKMIIDDFRKCRIGKVMLELP